MEVCDAEDLYSEWCAFRHYPRRTEGFRESSEAFNRTMHDFASVDPSRLLPAYQVPLIDIDFAVKQVHALAAEGARAVHIPTFPAELGLPEYHDERYDPAWSALPEPAISISPPLCLLP